MVKSIKVQNWRQRTKERIVVAMGGSCVCCGYSACINSLHCHHLDPTIKDGGLGNMRANPKSWATIVDELRKCVLICGNCHGEVHAGMQTIPNGAKRFDESFTEYKQAMAPFLDTCPICSGLKSPKLKTCSSVCAGKQHRRVDWDNIDLSVELRRFPSVVKLAEHLGISDAAVYKRMKRLGLR